MIKRPPQTVLSLAVFIFLLISLSGSNVSHPHSGARFYRGEIGVSTEWEGIIRVTGQVTVKRGVTLTISAGTKILVNSGEDVAIIVDGKLYVRGLPEMEVIFEPADGCSPDTFWGGIRFLEGASGVVEGARIKCSKKGIWGELADVRIIEVITDSSGVKR